MTIDDVTLDVKAGDAGTCVLHSAHGFNNNSIEDVEMISVGVAMVKGKIAHTELGDDLTKR